jgi:hypothetical protein
MRGCFVVKLAVVLLVNKVSSQIKSVLLYGFITIAASLVKTKCKRSVKTLSQ